MLFDRPGRDNEGIGDGGVGPALGHQRKHLGFPAGEPGERVGSSGGTDVGLPYVGTPQLLARYGIRSSQIDPAAVVLTSRAALAGAPALQLPFGCTFSSSCPPASCVANPRVQVLSQLPADQAEPNLVISPSAVSKYRLKPQTAAWLIQAWQPLTAAQVNGIRQRAESLGLTIETKNDNPSLSQLDAWATEAGILLALGVLAMTVGLVRGESAAELRLLTTVGATSRTRRDITAATAAGLGLLGALTGTAAACVAATAFLGGHLGEYRSSVPALDVLLILFGLPAIAAAGGWLLAGGEGGR